MDSMITDSAQQLIDETALAKKGEVKKNTKGRITFVGNPLKVFGVLFNHAYPLDLSITKYCFQGCPFCFATANKRAQGDVLGKNIDPTNDFIKKLQKANGNGYNPESLIEYCLHNKYPVIFSNNVDPFMPSSEEQFKLGERVLEACLEYNQPLFVQTKEVYHGERVKELLIKGKDIFHMYVSISTLDYDKAKQYETVTPPPMTRFERIKELTDAGMTATVALNPYTPEWQPNLREYFEEVKKCGAVGVYTDALHLTSNQKKVMPKRFGEFKDKVNRHREFEADCELMEDVAKEFDLKLYYTRRMPDDFYNGNGLFPQENVWPIDPQLMLEEIHKVWLEDKDPIMLQWADVDAYFEKHHSKLWNQIFSMTEFAGVMWTDNERYFHVKSSLGSRNKMKNIVKFIFNNPEQQDHFLAFYQHCFQLVDSTDTDNKEVESVYDDDGNIIWVYHPTYEKDGYYFDQNDEEYQLIELEG